MEISRVIDDRLLSTIISQLTELSRMIGEGSDDNGNLTVKCPEYFLFRFDMSRPLEAEEYGRYVACTEAIGTVLTGLGINMGYNGYTYIADAVKIIIDLDRYNIRLKSDVYPLIAIKHHVRKYTTVEHGIRNAINSAYADYIRDPSSNGMGVFPRRPANKSFLFFVADAARKCMYETMMSAAC